MTVIRGRGRGAGSRSAGPLVRLLLLLAVFPTAACYHYVPVDPEAPAKGDPIRAQVPALTVDIGDVAVQNVATVDGEFISVTEDRLLLSATWLTTGTGNEFDGLGHTVDLERRNLNALLEKRLHTRNTLLLAGAVTAGAFILHAVLDGGTFGGEGPGNGSGPPK